MTSTTKDATPSSPATRLGSLLTSGVAMVWGGLAIFALAKSVVHLLTAVGQANPIDGRNPISFCNVLFVGNLIAAVVLFIAYRRDWTRENFAKLSVRDWGGIVVMGVLSGMVAPTLGFLALAHAEVSTVVFLGRLEPIVLMILAASLLGDRPDRWAIFGAVVSTIGVIIILALLSVDMGGFTLGLGEFYAIMSAVVLAVGTVVSKFTLSSVPFGIFSVVRMIIGATIYFVWAYTLYGPIHFADVLQPVVWQWMLLYGAIIVAGGQMLFLNGIRGSRGQDVALAQSFSPIVAVAFAFLLLGEVPGTPILIGGAVIMVGIFGAQLGTWYSKRRKERLDNADIIEMEGRVTFRGV
ncbi:MAG: DMT family transporter [Hyphomicrobiaceae bacterium]|nr:DMT family transporter [Hyphomicrobiaceae bacterium]